MTDRIDQAYRRLLREGVIEWPNDTPEQRKAKKVRGAKCGHVKRRLLKNEPLEGKTLEYALSILNPEDPIYAKLQAGEQLTDYELHLMVDVYLLHERLSSI